MSIVYAIPHPFSSVANPLVIEVYGDKENSCYEWRIRSNERTTFDTATEGAGYIKGRQYGVAEIALRDALIFATLD
jgi:hypothetical protein